MESRLGLVFFAMLSGGTGLALNVRPLAERRSQTSLQLPKAPRRLAQIVKGQ
jgi:hypothetical protein